MVCVFVQLHNWSELVGRYCTIGRCCDAIPLKSVDSHINHRLYSPSIQILNIALQFTNATTLEQMKQPLSFQHQQCVHGDRRETLSSVISPDWFASPCPLSHPITAGSKKSTNPGWDNRMQGSCSKLHRRFTFFGKFLSLPFVLELKNCSKKEPGFERCQCLEAMNESNEETLKVKQARA